MAKLIDVGSAQGRRKFLRRVTAGAAVGGALVATNQASADHFSRTAAQQLAIGGANFKDIRAQKLAHVNYLKETHPGYIQHIFRNNLDITTGFHAFVTLAQRFTNFEVAFYATALPWVESTINAGRLTQVGLITARHAGWLNALQVHKLTTNAAGHSQTFEGQFSYNVFASHLFQYCYDGAGSLTWGFVQERNFLNDFEILNSAILMAEVSYELYRLNVHKYFA
jgi:hypothetical protein